MICTGFSLINLILNTLAMKIILFLLVVCLFSTMSFSQKQQKNITHYLFPEFIQGKVLMKKGKINEAFLNYNALTEEMIFESNGVKLALAQLEAIDTVFVSGKKFVPVNGKLYDLIYSSDYELFAEHKCKLNDPGKPAGYGTSSQLGAASTYSTYFSGNRVYEMTLPETVETNPYTVYYLKKDGVLLKFVSLKFLLKEFPEKSGAAKQFIRENNVSYDNPESMVKLIKFLESN